MASSASVRRVACGYAPSAATTAAAARRPAFRSTVGDACIVAKRAPRRESWRLAASGGDSGDGDLSKPAVSEDVLARLKKAEEEASELRKQLQAVQGDKPLEEEELEKPKRRIDSAGFRRETLFSKATGLQRDVVQLDFSIGLLLSK